MKIITDKKRLGQAPATWLREAGYVYLPNREGGNDSFARRLSRDFYPRFHVYFNEERDRSGREVVVFNLHLDQKRPGYEGFHRHNAEYDSETVAAEARRLESRLLPEFFV